jgi:hypothetical protein
MFSKFLRGRVVLLEAHKRFHELLLGAKCQTVAGNWPSNPGAGKRSLKVNA